MEKLKQVYKVMDFYDYFISEDLKNCTDNSEAIQLESQLKIISILMDEFEKIKEGKQFLKKEEN